MEFELFYNRLSQQENINKVILEKETYLINQRLSLKLSTTFSPLRKKEVIIYGK